MMKSSKNIILSRKEIFRPIMCSLWLMQLLTFCSLLKAQTLELSSAKSTEQYKSDTWGLFSQFKQFWKVFRHKRRVLLLTQENKRQYKNLILDLTRIIEKECKFNMFETLKCTLKILLLNEEEAYLSNDSHKTDMLT